MNIIAEGSELKLDLSSILTKDQRGRFETVLWLVGDGPRGSGRTELLALAFLQQAMHHPGMPIRFYDHRPTQINHNEILDRIVNMSGDLTRWFNDERKFPFTISFKINISKSTVTMKQDFQETPAAFKTNANKE